jgi:hypothetical protein
MSRGADSSFGFDVVVLVEVVVLVDVVDVVDDGPPSELCDPLLHAASASADASTATRVNEVRRGIVRRVGRRRGSTGIVSRRLHRY